MMSDWNDCLYRSCPECRVVSNYVVPSRYWVDEESKNRLISAYQSELR